MSSPVVHDPRGFALPDSQRAIIRWTIYLGFSALAVGVINGLGQALNYAGIDILRFFPGMRTYYQGLTVHGVFNALVFTFSFSNGFLLLTTARGLGRKCNDALLIAMFSTLVLGGLLASFAMFTGRASVLFTFYPPLEAHWTYYLGLALAVVSTWITSATQLVMLRGWRRENPSARVPLLAFLSIATYVMWDIASVGIAVEVVVFLLPWSLGLLPGVDPLFSRTLFWFSGHPIVYFWLLPIYVSWYAMVPQQAGGKLLSDTYARVVFLMFILLSIPVGFHHQFTDPGISNHWKFAHAVLTFAVFFPSLATAFSVMYALEIGARRRGGTGLAALVPQGAVERPFALRADPRHVRLHARRHHRPDECELQHEPGRPQHRLHPRPFPSDRRHRGGALRDGHRLLAGALSDEPQALERAHRRACRDGSTSSAC